ncbi:YwqG family protein [Entamoeba marina]
MSQPSDFDKVFDKILGEIISSTSIPSIQFELSEDEPSIFNSKIGGEPYLPKGFDYPCLKNGDKHPLMLLAQLNFEEFDHIDDFPETGILQIYIDGGDSDFALKEKEENQNGFRVIYHEKIIKDETLLDKAPDVPQDESPIEKCRKLKGKKIDMPITFCDFRLEKLVKKYSAKYNVDEDKLRDTLIDSDSLNGDMIGIGGYPFFASEDFRSYGEESENYTVTLFTCNANEAVSWCDDEIANFLITKENLLKKDFSDIYYYCGYY